VEAVVFFEEDTPYNLIDLVKPDVLVKGGDYTEENIVGADVVKANGGSVVIIPLVEGYSTSGIIKKL
jgi:D-beta-D-heptose 7-phosphate kinase/D-beta-D-heptose 1-phosphate adenosyltransferase